ncbi:hypothetical protein [Sporosarcina sp. YIM B06819]|uniref:RNA polymerase factor sigma-54 n=1 Tax=Sporosarcina sp. YIM B06819 TaxID=3081769 RepID=UPI003995187C
MYIRLTRLNEQQINEGIHLLQTVVPTEIGARYLAECLLLQSFVAQKNKFKPYSDQ